MTYSNGLVIRNVKIVLNGSISIKLWFANQWNLFHTRQVLCVVMLVVARDWENVWQNMNVLLTVLLVDSTLDTEENTTAWQWNWI